MTEKTIEQMDKILQHTLCLKAYQVKMKNYEQCEAKKYTSCKDTKKINNQYGHNGRKSINSNKAVQHEKKKVEVEDWVKETIQIQRKKKRVSQTPNNVASIPIKKDLQSGKMI